MAEHDVTAETFADLMGRAVALLRSEGIEEATIEQLQNRLESKMTPRGIFLEFIHAQLQTNVAIVSALVGIASGDDDQRNDRLAALVEILTKQAAQFGRVATELMVHDGNPKRERVK